MGSDLASIPDALLADAVRRLPVPGPQAKPTSVLIDTGDRWAGRYLVAFVPRRAGSHDSDWSWSAVSAQRLDTTPSPPNR